MPNLNYSQKAISSLLFLFSAIIPAAIIPLLNGDRDLIIEITFSILLIESAVFMIVVPGIFGKLYYLFSYIFFAITPWLQFKNAIIFWGFPSIENATYVEINFILIVLNLFYFISYLYGKKRGLKNNSDPSPIFIIKKDQFYLGN